MIRSSKSIILILTLSIIVTLAWPVLPWREETAQFDISITATGAKNPQSHSAEVWVIGLPEGLSQEQVLASAPNWAAKDGFIVSYQEQPATIHVIDRFAKGARIDLLRHAWSGIAQVEINGATKTYDLFDPASSREILSLWDFPPYEISYAINYQFFVVVLTVFLFLLAAVSVIALAIRRGNSPAPKRYELAIFSLPSLLTFAAVLVGTWPAQMSPDSVGQWEQLFTGEFSNAHPIIGTMLMGFAGWAAGSIGVSSIVQILMLALAIGTLCYSIRKWGGPFWLVLIVAVITPLWPGVHFLSTVFWKDIPYAIVIVFATAAMSEIVRSEGRALGRPWFAASFGILLFLLPGIRMNGLIVSAGLAVLVLWIFRRSVTVPGAVGIAAAGIALPIVWTQAVVPNIGVTPLPPAYDGVTAMHILAAMERSGAELPPSTRAHMDAIMPLEDWREKYSCLNSVGLFWSPTINYEHLDGSLISPALNAMVDHPVVALKHYICANSLTWRISPTENFTNQIVPLSIYPPPPEFNHTPEFAPIDARVYNWLLQVKANTTSSAWSFSLFWRPAIMVLGLSFIAVIWLLRGMPKRYLLITAPVALNTLSMLPVMPAQDFRYHYPLVVTFFCLAGLLLWLLWRGDTKRVGDRSH